jgi:hypothetical protein
LSCSGYAFYDSVIFRRNGIDSAYNQPTYSGQRYLFRLAIINCHSRYCGNNRYYGYERVRRGCIKNIKILNYETLKYFESNDEKQEKILFLIFIIDRRIDRR